LVEFGDEGRSLFLFVEGERFLVEIETKGWDHYDAPQAVKKER
jgi:hypothetical protein